MRSWQHFHTMAALACASNLWLPLDRGKWLQKIDHQLQITRIPCGYSQALGNEHHTTSSDPVSRAHDNFGDRWVVTIVNQVTSLFPHSGGDQQTCHEVINRLTYTPSLKDNPLPWSSKRDISFGLIKRLSLARDNFWVESQCPDDIFNIKSVKTTLRPVSAAASKTCWIRRLLATAATMIRPSQSVDGNFIPNFTLARHLDIAISIGWITEERQDTITTDFCQTGKSVA